MKGAWKQRVRKARGISLATPAHVGGARIHIVVAVVESSAHAASPL